MYLYIIFIEIDGGLPVGWLVKAMHCGVVCIVGSNLLVLRLSGWSGTGLRCLWRFGVLGLWCGWVLWCRAGG